MFSKKILYSRKHNKYEDFDIPDFVKNIVEIKDHGSEMSFSIYPRNTPETLINLEDSIRGDIGSKTPVVKDITIQGSKTDYTNAYHPKHCHFISIRFTTNGYYKLLDVPQKIFTNNFPDLDDVIDCNIDRIIPKLNHETSRKGRLKILFGWLKRDVRQEGGFSRLLSDFIIANLKQNPHLSVAQLAEQTGYTRKHLLHKFKEEAGLTIKEYQKINRLQRVRKSVSEREDVPWAEVACEHGFYDQSHLIRDFKRYTGCTPTDYLNRRELAKA